MKSMRKVVSTFLLVCMLASMLMVSASAEVGVSIKYALESEAQGGGYYEIANDGVLNVMLAVALDDGLTASDYSVVWYLDGMPYGTPTSVGVGPGVVNISDSFDGASLGTGTHKLVPYVENGDTFQKAAQGSGFTVVVADPAPVITGVAFNVPSVELKRYEDYSPVFATVYSTGASYGVSYEIVTVDGTDPVAVYDETTQTIHAVNSGMASLTATALDETGNPTGFSSEIKIYVKIPVSSISIDTQYLNNPSDGDEICYTVISDKATWPTLQWTSSNSKVAYIESDSGAGVAYIALGGANGTATITATSTDGTAVNGKCIVTVDDAERTCVTVTPTKADLFVGETTTLTAYVTGRDSDDNTSYFDHWYCSSNAVQLTRDGNTVTVKAISAVTNPIEVRAYSNDGKYGYALIYISKSDPLEIVASDTTVKANKTVVVSVTNARPNETFTWSYTPDDIGFIKSTSVKGNNFSLIGGDLEGSITVTCASNNDSTRTASVMIGINSVDPYGTAYITPKSVNWTRGNGDLSFQVSPAAYWTYLDNQFLNTKSTSLASYWNGTLTLKAAYLNTLSNGTHTLKVYTATDSNNNPIGLVYANIYISGNGVLGASATYGDNAHVKGAASNLYFNSANPISDVYISGKLIDPSNYSLSTDGKTLTLSSSFLNQLAYGSYTMQLNGTNGTTQTTNFRIVTANYAPSTGDENNIGLWVAIMILSGAGAVALIPKKKNSVE